MKWKFGIIFGLLVWLIPFVVSLLIYPLKTANSPLFETIMPVVLVLVGSLFLFFYMEKDTYLTPLKGLELGLIFFIISIILDLFMFTEGPMKMSFVDYMLDIGLTYLIYPILGIFFGLISNNGEING